MKFEGNSIWGDYSVHPNISLGRYKFMAPLVDCVRLTTLELVGMRGIDFDCFHDTL
jgi:hypothetical protein